MDGSPPVRPCGARSLLWAQKDMVRTQQGRAPAGDNTQCGPRKSLTPLTGPLHLSSPTWDHKHQGSTK